MSLDFHRQVKLGGAPQCLPQDFRFETHLRVVVNVLVLASATASKVWTRGLSSLLRWLQHAFESSSRESRTLFHNRGFDSLAGQHERNEDSLGALFA